MMNPFETPVMDSPRERSWAATDDAIKASEDLDKAAARAMNAASLNERRHPFGTPRRVLP
jgi:hypothetical protein